MDFLGRSLVNSLNLRICRSFNWQLLLTCLSLIIAAPVGARELQFIESQPASIHRSRFVAQAATNAVKVTAVTVNPTATGVEVILTTPAGNIVAPAAQVRDNLLYFDLPNVSLALPDRAEFRVEAPASGIANVVVTQVNERDLRVLVRGTSSVPIATLTLTDGTSAPVAQTPSEPELEINVVGLQNRRGYKLPNSSTATKTDTPLKDIPQSITIIPPQILQDRGINKVGDALENVSGIVRSSTGSSIFGDNFNIRGFQGGASIFRDGVPHETSGTLGTSDIDRIEVLKGPSSVLFGAGEPGGIVNIVSKQPLSKPYAKAEVSAGGFSTYRGAIDLSGPIDPAKKILYRINADYETSGSFRDFVNSKNFSIAPVVTAALSENTKVSVYGKFRSEEETGDEGIIPIDGRVPNVPIGRFLGEPFGKRSTDTINIGYTIDHKFSDNWSVRHNTNYLSFDFSRYFPLLDSVDPITGDVSRTAYSSEGKYTRFSTNADVTGKIATGNIQHTILLGTEFRYGTENPQFGFAPYDPINLFNPVYARRLYERQPVFFRDDNFSTFAVYLQDRVTLSPTLKVLAGARFDTARQFRTTQDVGEARQEFSQTDSALSPRVGIIYQPVEPISLYASYTRSFKPSFGASRNLNDAAFLPETGAQVEVGVKTDLSPQLSLNVAAFDIKKQNVETPDPSNPDFTLQTGEQTSKGIELDLTGKILPGLNLTLAYAYTDAFVSRDNTFAVGSRLTDVPYHQASLLTTYEFQQESLKGLGVSLGLYAVGSRPGDLSNSYELPAYLRTDVSAFYKKDNWRAQLNFRNLFNQGYFINTTSGTFSPGAPFNVTASLGVEF